MRFAKDCLDSQSALSEFSIFSIIKNDFLKFCFQVNSISAPVLFKNPTPSQIYLIKNAQNPF